MDFQIIFLFFIALYLIVALFLNYLQKKSVLANINLIPAQFDTKINLTEHQKAANYTLAKLQLNNLEVVFSVAILLLFTLGGGIDFVNNLFNQHLENPLILGSVIIVGIMILSSILELPFSLYKTFILEAKFGFNQTTKKYLLLILLRILSLVLLSACRCLWLFYF